MDKIKVRDREFTVSIPEAKILQRVAEVAAQINNDLKNENPLFLAVLNGSFVFAADLMRCMETSSTGKVKQLIGLKEEIKGRTVVIVEDIIDSGLTMKNLLATLEEKQPKDIRIAALLVKPGNLQVDLDIPYCCFDIPNDFIVGYGLDYDGEGRNLRSIYTVVE